MVWKANLIFDLLNSYNSTSYQTQFTKLDRPNQNYQSKFVPRGLNQIYETKSTNPYLQNQIYKIKSTKQNIWNVKNQINQTKFFQ